MDGRTVGRRGRGGGGGGGSLIVCVTLNGFTLLKIQVDS